MKYDLELPRWEFDQTNNLVKAVLVNSGRPPFKYPSLITSDPEALSPDNGQHILEHINDWGWCYAKGVDSFEIWINPMLRIVGMESLYRETVLHELCHGYLGVYQHNHKWKRFFGRAAFHHADLVTPFNDTPSLVHRTLKRYTNSSRDESWSKYCDRIENEAAALAKQSVEERFSVARSYQSFCKESFSAQGLVEL